MLFPKLTGGSKEMKRSWTSLSPARSRPSLSAADNGVGNGESEGSDFGSGEPEELSFSAGCEGMACGLQALVFGEIRCVVRSMRMLTDWY